MKAIMVMFDSLNRHMLPPYGCDWVHAPNFQRLAAHSAVFDRSFVGSMPCIPARREIHTGRPNFLHRSWGPLEPFDDSMPQILKENGVHSHLASDHYHYWEDGGCTYHSRYSTWEIVRGQEGDPWICDLRDEVPIPEMLAGARGNEWLRQDWVNRFHTQDEKDHPQAATFTRGLEFLQNNHRADNWFLQLETFDPHEPYRVPERFQKLYPHGWTGPHFDWPEYDKVKESPEAVEHLRCLNAALISMCDESLGRVLDFMDAQSMWDDTLLIVNTDHGFLLGEHDSWAKCWLPYYNEIAWTPLFVWDPRFRVQGQRRQSLVQTIDLAPTLLEFFGAPVPKDMLGRPLGPVIRSDDPIHAGGLFGMHGGHVNVTDGRYIYMRAPAEGSPNEPVFQYTLMPTHMHGFFPIEDLKTAEMAGPFSFTKGSPVMKIHGGHWPCRQDFKTMLWDIEKDPEQKHPLHDPAIEQRMTELMVKLMQEADAPAEQYERLGLGRG